MKNTVKAIPVFYNAQSGYSPFESNISDRARGVDYLDYRMQYVIDNARISELVILKDLTRQGKNTYNHIIAILDEINTIRVHRNLKPFDYKNDGYNDNLQLKLADFYMPR